jgi:hypothetical protein
MRHSVSNINPADQKLQNTAQAFQVQSHGSYWLLDTKCLCNPKVWNFIPCSGPGHWRAFPANHHTRNPWIRQPATNTQQLACKFTNLACKGRASGSHLGLWNTTKEKSAVYWDILQCDVCAVKHKSRALWDMQLSFHLLANICVGQSPFGAPNHSGPHFNCLSIECLMLWVFNLCSSLIIVLTSNVN